MRNTNEGLCGNENEVVAKVEAPPSTGNQQTMQGPKEKGYNRHTKHQIQEMKSFFKQCRYPSEMQMRELARYLALKPIQIKYWFQNKNARIKSQDKRKENKRLRAENKRIVAENQRYKEILSKALCPECGDKLVERVVRADIEDKVVGP